MTKMTYANAIEMVLAMDSVKANTELVDKLEALKASLAKKATSKGERKATPQQVENGKIKEAILGILKDNYNHLLTITDIVKALGDDFGDLSNQRVSQIVRQMYTTDGTVERIEDKRKAYFRIVE